MKDRAFSRLTRMVVIGFAGLPGLVLAQTAGEGVFIRVTEGRLSDSSW